jgi:dynein heavy chain 1
LFAFKNMPDHISNNPEVWSKFWNDSRAEAHVPVFWEPSEADSKFIAPAS